MAPPPFISERWRVRLWVQDPHCVCNLPIIFCYIINNGVTIFTLPECAVCKILLAIEFLLNRSIKVKAYHYEVSTSTD